MATKKNVSRRNLLEASRTPRGRDWEPKSVQIQMARKSTKMDEKSTQSRFVDQFSGILGAMFALILRVFFLIQRNLIFRNKY